MGRVYNFVAVITCDDLLSGAIRGEFRWREILSLFGYSEACDELRHSVLATVHCNNKSSSKLYINP